MSDEVKERKRLYSKNYNETNKELIKVRSNAKRIEYRDNNRGRLQDYGNMYYEMNKDKINAKILLKRQNKTNLDSGELSPV